MKQLLHTPEGVRDIYNIECGKKLVLEREIRKVFKSYGYHNIQTPTFEYFDVFSKEIGTVPSKELYKFTDREGETLVLRPDITPSIARVAATLYANQDLPIRLCYTGNVFINHSSYQGRMKENTQMGVELIGDDSVYADGEMLALVVESLLSAGLKEFQISVSDAGFFKSIIGNGNFNEEDELKIRELINNRNFYATQEHLESINASSECINSIAALDELFGGVEILEHAKKITSTETGTASINRLLEIYEILKSYGLEEYINFDLSMSGGSYDYYTGIIFRGYTFGVGDAIVKGGRYDHLIEKFGKNSPSIGFVIVVDELLNAINRQNVVVPYVRKNTLVLFRKNEFELALREASAIRADGQEAEMIQLKDDKSIDDYIEYGKEFYAKQILYFNDDSQLQTIDLTSK
ncbi:MAG: ATP phosphoribosyltransferase regulatory subunit [Suipraeoptans sp.]